MKLLSHYIEQQMKRHPTNWQNHIFGDTLSYAYRDTVYDRESYPSDLHYHDYYELVIFEEGDIRYICEGAVYHPQYGDIILIPPCKFHMSAINGERTRYRRHVFYLYPTAFDAVGHHALVAFLERAQEGTLLAFSSLEQREELTALLWHLKSTLEGAPSPLEEALGLSDVLRVFYLLNQEDCRVKSGAASLPENILLLQQYIDRHFAEISSVTQLAEHFFYSREYVSRLFRKYFDTTVSDYITRRRIAKSQVLIREGISLIEIADLVGFGSLSTFLRAFRAVTGMTPTAYRRLRGEL